MSCIRLYEREPFLLILAGRRFDLGSLSKNLVKRDNGAALTFNLHNQFSLSNTLAFPVMRPSTLVALVFAGLVQAAPLPQQLTDSSIPASPTSNVLSAPASVSDSDSFPKLLHEFAEALSTYEHQYASTTTTGQAPIVVKRSEPDATQAEADPELVTLSKRQQWPGFVKQIAQRIAGVVSNSILGMIGSA